MSRWLIHKDQSNVSNALCVVYYVDTINTGDQSQLCLNGSNTMLCYVNTVDSQMHTDTFLSITLLIFNGFSIWNQGFPNIQNLHTCQYCQYRHKISNAFNAMYVNTVNTNMYTHFYP